MPEASNIRSAVATTTRTCPRMTSFRAVETDEWIAIAVRDDKGWSGLCSLLGHGEWTQAYATPEDRRAAADTIHPAIEEWTRSRSALQAFHALQQGGVAAAPSFTNKELAGDPHLAARGVFVDVQHPVIGKQTVMRAPWLMAGTDLTPRRGGPLLGEDSRWLVLEVLGESAPEAADWEEIFD